MPDPSSEWPFYQPDAPQRPCVADTSLIHEGDEIEDCEFCIAPEPDPLDVLEGNAAEVAE